MSENRAEAVAIVNRLAKMAERSDACPNCFSGNYYVYASRKVLKCRDCEKQYTPLWWTPFYYHKLPVADLLQIASLRLVHRMPMLQIANRMGVDYKTVWSFCKKLAIYADALEQDIKASPAPAPAPSPPE